MQTKCLVFTFVYVRMTDFQKNKKSLQYLTPIKSSNYCDIYHKKCNNPMHWENKWILVDWFFYIDNKEWQIDENNR